MTENLYHLNILITNKLYLLIIFISLGVINDGGLYSCITNQYIPNANIELY